METSLNVSGMTCRSIVRHINAALHDLPGVTKVEVRLADGRVVVTHDAAASPVGDIVQAIEHAPA